MKAYIKRWILTPVLSASLAGVIYARPNAKDVFSNPRMVKAAHAVEHDDTAALDELVKTGLNANEPGKQGITLLYWAMMDHKQASLRELLKLKADPNQKVENGDSVMTLAAAVPDSELLKILLESGGDPNARTGKGTPAIDEALDRSLWNNFDLLVSHGADPGATDKSGATAFVRLAQVQQFLDIERLLGRGLIDINKPDRHGITLAWYVEHSPVSPNTKNGQARDRLRKVLKQRGAK